MIRLGLETATDFCSVALDVDGEISVREQLAPRRHAELLIPWVRELLAERGIGFADLDALAVSRGPGGFTSLRIGLGVAQGIALANDLPIHPVSTLAVLARAADPDCQADHVLAMLDARMSEVYAGWFERRGDRHELVMPEIVIAPDRLEPPGDGPWLIAGSGWFAYDEILAQRLSGRVREARPDIWPDARSVLALAGEAEAVTAWRLEPRYVRDEVTG